MHRINFDQSANLKLIARINENGTTKTLIFTNVDGTPFDITELDFRLLVTRVNALKKLFTLSIGDGLTIVDTNKLVIALTAAKANVQTGTYFYRLHSESENRSWLNGSFEFHELLNEPSIDSTIVSVGSADVVNITVVSGGGGSTPTQDGVTIYKGDWDLSSNIVPNNINGEPVKKGFQIRVWPNGSSIPLLPDGGIAAKGTMLQALKNNPGQDLTDPSAWAIYYTVV